MPDHDIQRIYSLLETIRDDIAEQGTDIAVIKTKVDAIEAERLTNRLTTIEANQKSCPAREAYQGAARRESASLLISVLSALIAGAAIFIAWVQGK